MSTLEALVNVNEEQSPPSKKRSFLQRLNKRHGTLSLHMRSKRGGKFARAHNDRASHSRNTSSSQNEVSEAPSLISSSTSERKQSETGSRYYDIEDDISPTTPAFSVAMGPENEFEVPIRYVVARNDKEAAGQDFTQGMQDFVHRKQASNASSIPSCPPYAPPLPPGAQQRSKSASSQMSDEQMEKWLEPEDAELHRERKSSENLHSTAQLAEKGKEGNLGEENIESGEEKTIMADCSDYVAVAYPDSWNTDPEDEGKHESGTPKTKTREKGSCAEKGVRRVAFTQDESQGMLCLPDELLQKIALHLDTNSTWHFRLSCKRLYHKIPAPPLPPSGTDAELQTFFNQIKPLIPDDLTFCRECKIYHPWTMDDYYFVDKSRRRRSQLCRRHLNAGKQSQEEILGIGKFVCENCNTRREGKRCKTCNKCEECARLKRSWMLMSWVEEECDYCAASHSPKWKHYKGEFEGRLNPGEYREWTGV